MRRAQKLSLFVLLFATVASNAKDAAPAGLPDWISGHWCSRNGAEQSEEYWLTTAGGLMMGMSRTVAPGHETQFEYMRIELVDGVPTFLAQPGGRAATAFKRTDGGSEWVRFENLAHDFPQRIEYRRNGDALRAEITGPGKDGAELRIPFEFKRCGD